MLRAVPLESIEHDQRPVPAEAGRDPQSRRRPGFEPYACGIGEGVLERVRPITSSRLLNATARP